MSQDSTRRAVTSLYSDLDLGTSSVPAHFATSSSAQHEQTSLLREILASLDRNNDLIEELMSTLGSNQKQRATELNQWKQANPELAQSCHNAAEALSQVQVAFLNKMTDEINDSVEGLMDGEFLLTEFVDRFGPRLAHLNGVIQVLSQLSSMNTPSDSSH
jgi:hypothetical protein